MTSFIVIVYNSVNSKYSFILSLNTLHYIFTFNSIKQIKLKLNIISKKLLGFIRRNDLMEKRRILIEENVIDIKN